jgi:hypothetical protein
MQFDTSSLHTGVYPESLTPTIFYNSVRNLELALAFIYQERAGCSPYISNFIK